MHVILARTYKSGCQHPTKSFHPSLHEFRQLIFASLIPFHCRFYVHLSFFDSKMLIVNLTVRGCCLFIRPCPPPTLSSPISFREQDATLITSMVCVRAFHHLFPRSTMDFVAPPGTNYSNSHSRFAAFWRFCTSSCGLYNET